jgi:hypothetical protein
MALISRCHHYQARDGARDSHNGILSDEDDDLKDGMRSSLLVIVGLNVLQKGTATNTIDCEFVERNLPIPVSLILPEPTNSGFTSFTKFHRVHSFTYYYSF